MPRKRWLLVVAVPVLLIAGVLAVKRETIRIGIEGYLYGYPLVIMDLTRAASVQFIGPENQLYRKRRFPDPAFHGVPRPNVDTLYTTAFIDMAAGPFVFEMAPNQERYELMPFMDAWTNVFASLGTRTTGTAGGQYLLAPSHWQGELPQGLELIRVPTRMVWLIGRTQTNGAADYPLVHRLQDGIRLRPLAHWLAGEDPPRDSITSEEPGPQVPLGAAPPPAPVIQLQAMSTEALFARLSALLLDNPPAAADAPMLAKLARIGVVAGQPLHWSRLDRCLIDFGRRLADFKIARELKKPRNLLRGWATPPRSLGAYGSDYATRAVVAMVGLGANLPADAMYPNCKLDSLGRPLDGSHRYRLHFAAGQLPPVRAFWSLTAYGPDDFLIENPIHRYAIGDRDPLLFNADGSLDLLVQAEAPPPAQQANWLPVKAAQPFLLNARLYWPQAAALDGNWAMPAVERLD